MIKFKWLGLAVLPLALTACQSYEVEDMRNQTSQLINTKQPNKILTSYVWSTDTGASKPLVLSFYPDGLLSIATSCNTMNTSWQVKTSQIHTGLIYSTLMACSNQAMQQEQIAADLLQQRAVTYHLDFSRTKPRLTLISPNGKRYVFTGKMTPEAQYQTEAETIFLEISPQKKACTGVIPQSCLQVKEIKYNQQGLKTYQDRDWSLFYSSIEGFEHNPNERQVIRVKRYERPNPAADQSRYIYIHDMTIERETLR